MGDGRFDGARLSDCGHRHADAASVDEEGDADIVSELVASAAADAGEELAGAPAPTVSQGRSTTDIGNGTIAISLDMEDGLSMARDDGLELGLQLPGDRGTRGALSQDGTVVYEDPLLSTHVTARADLEGVQASLVIEDAMAPSTFRFPVELPSGYALTLDTTGVVRITDANGVVAASFEAPWAVDASGAAVPTSYSVEGTTLVQHVAHAGAADPVVADPKFTWGWVTGTVYFSRRETNVIASGGTGATGLLALATGVGAAAVGVYASYATYVYNQNHCLKIKITAWGPVPGEYWGNDAGGYCR